MAQPITFTSKSPRLKLPFLATAQSQKEFTVNQAYAVIDALMHIVIEGTADTPPTSPAEGECWIVGTSPTDAWAGEADTIAAFQANTWIFITPLDGMSVFDKAIGARMFRIDGAWSSATNVASPAGGSTVDTEARAALDEIRAALQVAGILPTI